MAAFIEQIGTMFTGVLDWLTEASTSIMANPLLLVPIVFAISFIVLRFVFGVIRNIQS